MLRINRHNINKLMLISSFRYVYLVKFVARINLFNTFNHVKNFFLEKKNVFFQIFFT